MAIPSPIESITGLVSNLGHTQSFGGTGTLTVDGNGLIAGFNSSVYVNYAIGSDPASPLTVCADINTAFTGRNIILARSEVGGGGFFLEQNLSGNIYLTILAVGAYTLGNVLGTGIKRIGVTLTSTSGQLYVNGVASGSPVTVGNIGSKTSGFYTVGAWLGGGNSPNNPSDTGAVAGNHRVYPAALDATDMLLEYATYMGGTTHATTGALSGQGASVSGSSRRFRAFSTTGALIGQGASVTGSATRFRAHPSSGVLIGQGSTVVGSSARFRAFATSGILLGQGSALSGSAARVGAPPNHVTTGSLIGQGSTLNGSAARIAAAVTHATTGILAGQGSLIVGSANRASPAVTHNTSGILVGQGSIVNGQAKNGTASSVGKPTRRHKYIVEKDGQLRIYNNKQDAINALNKLKKEPETIVIDDVDVNVPSVEIKQPERVKQPVMYDINAMLEELRGNAKAQALIQQKNYEQFIKSYERWIDDQEVEMLLLGIL